MSRRSPPVPPEKDSTAAAGEAAPKSSLTKAEQARRLYVSGQAATLAECAAIVGCTPGHLDQTSAEQGWVEQRRVESENRRAALAREGMADEAKVQAVARRTAWLAAWKALDRVLASLDKPKTKVTANHAEALVRAALSLSGIGDLGADEGAARLRGVSIQEVFAQLQVRLTSLGANVRLGPEAAVPVIDAVPTPKT